MPPFVLRFDAGSVPVGDLVFSSTTKTVADRLSRSVFDEVGLPREADVYLCGPTRFMAEMKDALATLGVAPERSARESGRRLFWRCCTRWQRPDRDGRFRGRLSAMWRRIMKTLITALALATLIVAPTFTQSAAVDVSPHLFRTAAASTAAAYGGKTPYLASALLNHTDPRVTEEHYNRASSVSASKIHSKSPPTARHRSDTPERTVRLPQKSRLRTLRRG
jgi:hypothetical protein